MTHLSGESIRHGECGRDPAECIDHICGQATDDALDGLPDILRRGNYHGTCE